MSRAEHPWEALSAFLDGELPPAEREAVERHLDVCKECQACLDDLRHLGRGVVEAPVPAPPPGLAKRIVARSIGKASRPDRSILRGRRWWSAGSLAAAASLLVAVFLGYLAGRDYLKPVGTPLPPSRQEQPEAAEKSQVFQKEAKKEDLEPAWRREEIEPKVIGGIERQAMKSAPVPQPAEVAKRQLVPETPKGSKTDEELPASERGGSKPLESAPGVASAQPEVKGSGEKNTASLEDGAGPANENRLLALPSPTAPPPPSADTAFSARAASSKERQAAKATTFAAKSAASPNRSKEKGVCSEPLSRGRAEWKPPRFEEAVLSLEDLAKRMGGACLPVRNADEKPTFQRWELRIPGARWNEALLELTRLGVTLQEAETEKPEATPHSYFSLEIRLYPPPGR